MGGGGGGGQVGALTPKPPLDPPLRQVPCKMLKISDKKRYFRLHPMDLANVNAMKKCLIVNIA